MYPKSRNQLSIFPSGVWETCILKNPQKYSKLAVGTNIYFLNMATNQIQARDVVFADFIEKQILVFVEKLGKNQKLIKTLLEEYNQNYNFQLSELKIRLSELLDEERNIEQEIQKETEKFSQLETTDLELFKKHSLKTHDELKERYETNQNLKLEIEQKISETEFSEVNPNLLSEILINLSKILPDLPMTLYRLFIAYLDRSSVDDLSPSIFFAFVYFA